MSVLSSNVTSLCEFLLNVFFLLLSLTSDFTRTLRVLLNFQAAWRGHRLRSKLFAILGHCLRRGDNLAPARLLTPTRVNSAHHRTGRHHEDDDNDDDIDDLSLESFSFNESLLDDEVAPRPAM